MRPAPDPRRWRLFVRDALVTEALQTAGDSQTTDPAPDHHDSQPLASGSRVLTLHDNGGYRSGPGAPRAELGGVQHSCLVRREVLAYLRAERVISKGPEASRPSTLSRSSTTATPRR